MNLKRLGLITLCAYFIGAGLSFGLGSMYGFVGFFGSFFILEKSIESFDQSINKQ